MSLLPTFIDREILTAPSSEDTEAYENDVYEWGVDFDTGELTGRLVERREHVKVWIWKCLMTERFRYPIYTWAYGSELEKYIGKSLTDEYAKTDVRLSLEDALYINPDIRRIYNYSAKINGDRLLLSFDVDSVYGKVSIVDYERSESNRKAWYEAERAAAGIRSGAICFRIDEDGRLIMHKYATTDRAMAFRITPAGHLQMSRSKQFAAIADLSINPVTGHLEANIDV